MTQDEFPKTAKGRLIEASRIIGAVLIVLSFIGAALAWFGPIDDQLEEWEEDRELLIALDQKVTNIDEDIDALQMEQQVIRRDVDIATRPNQIFEVNSLQSGARDGGCVVFQQCTIDLRVRRTVEGLNCKIIPESERSYFIEADSGARIQVQMLSGTPSTNIARDWFDYHRTFQLPDDLQEPVGFMYEASYDRCRNSEDETVITQESPVIPVPIRTISEAPFGPGPAIAPRGEGPGE